MFAQTGRTFRTISKPTKQDSDKLTRTSGKN
jgi:hypothetical protein